MTATPPAENCWQKPLESPSALSVTGKFANFYDRSVSVCSLPTDREDVKENTVCSTEKYQVGIYQSTRRVRAYSSTNSPLPIGPPQHNLDPRQKLLGVERFGDIIVRAQA